MIKQLQPSAETCAKEHWDSSSSRGFLVLLVLPRLTGTADSWAFLYPSFLLLFSLPNGVGDMSDNQHMTPYVKPCIVYDHSEKMLYDEI